MKARPSFQFYPSDWLRDPGLRSCSLAARGLWIDMLTFMHEAEPYGHLRLQGRDLSPEILARMVGSSLKVVRRLLAELETAGVFSRTDQGGLYSRRMVRDHELREKRGQYGHLSQNHPLVPKKRSEKDTFKDSLMDTIPSTFGGSPSSSSSSSFSSSKKKEKDMLPAVDQEFEEFWKLYPAKNGKKVQEPEALRRFRRLTPEDRQLVLVAVRNYANSSRVAAGYIMDPHGWLKKGKTEPWRDWITPEEKPKEKSHGNSWQHDTGFADKDYAVGTF